MSPGGRRSAGGAGSQNDHGVPYVHGRPDFRSGNTFFKTSENGHQWEDPATFAALSWDIVSGIYRHGKPVNSLIRALFCSAIRLEDTTVLDFIRYAVKYFISTQQEFIWAA